MKATVFLIMFVVSLSSVAWGYDNGPQTIGCDYKQGKATGTSTCLIVGSGMNQGISWLVFEVNGKRWRYTDASREIELVNATGATIKQYTVSHSSSQCRPGGKPADVYTFPNGNHVCLYW
ncbi:hypothetical protein [Stenotrophobium rhamnosiphilum]|uniref:Ig-like domain-containing protein n=1 Tax=Stenotrophobium rhamnosiphilum TaxID=2029166 RepID=A0A2T5MEE9_9GAMM|nr:hypothetical protein [Stenotrophobium rhamnosiphilum]PTU30961.1 hypothetical protein CJD38_11685 [Stenotrophobium rhamnosiphilum]